MRGLGLPKFLSSFIVIVSVIYYMNPDSMFTFLFVLSISFFTFPILPLYDRTLSVCLSLPKPYTLKPISFSPCLSFSVKGTVERVLGSDPVSPLSKNLNKSLKNLPWSHTTCFGALGLRLWGLGLFRESFYACWFLPKKELQFFGSYCRGRMVAAPRRLIQGPQGVRSFDFILTPLS